MGQPKRKQSKQRSRKRRGAVTLPCLNWLKTLKMAHAFAHIG